MDNRLLASLPSERLERLTPHLSDVSFSMKQEIYAADAPIEDVYFPTTGVASLLITTSDGGTVEVGTVGNEGVVGASVSLGADRSPTRVVSQIPVSGFRMSVAAFTGALKDNGDFEGLIRRYVQSMIDQISQSVACNYLHSIEERACRWLLMCHDRVRGDSFPLSQEFLAQMLGVRRPSVTIAAGILQKAGLISYHRGHMTIVDRRRLEESACECYRVVKDKYDRMLGS